MQENLAERVIAAFGGLTDVHKATGWPISTIQGWKESGRIPGWRRDPIIAAAKAGNIELPAEFTAEQTASP